MNKVEIGKYLDSLAGEGQARLSVEQEDLLESEWKERYYEKKAFLRCLYDTSEDADLIEWGDRE